MLRINLFSRTAGLTLARAAFVFRFVKLGGSVKKVRDVEKRVPLKTHIDESRLHPRKDTRHSPFVDTTCKAFLRFALDVNLDELIIFQNADTGFVPRCRDNQFL